MTFELGLSLPNFWDLTYKEITDIIQAHNKKVIRQAKEKAVYDYTLAQLIGRTVGQIITSNNKVPKLWDVYPELFKEEKEKFAKEEQERKWKDIQNKMLAYNERFKALNKQKGGN